MFRNYIAAALRSLVRNKLYAAINIVGLAVGFAAALLIALFVRDEYSYDKSIPGYEGVYRISQTLRVPARAPDQFDTVLGHTADWFKADFPEIETIARIARPGNESPGTTSVALRRNDIEGNERQFYWADPDIFALFPFPVIAGDLQSALRRPDGLVITRKIARKYFRSDAPLGETLEIDRAHTMTVTAVIEDLPSNTHLAIDALGSGLAPFSRLAEIDASPMPRTGQAFTYFRLKRAGTVQKIEAALPEFIDRHTPPLKNMGLNKASENWSVQIVPVAAIHLRPSASWDAMKPAGELGTIYALAAIAALLIVVAAFNFVNLTTARSMHRAVEVGVRKTSGAQRRDLTRQFLGEATIYALFATLVGALLAKIILPFLNDLLGRAIGFNFTDPLIIVAALALGFGVGLMSGTYPALVLSRFPPAASLKMKVQSLGTAALRSVLVIGQFSILIGLAIVTVCVFEQTTFALTKTISFDKDQVLLVRTACANDAFKDAVRRLPGVHDVACSTSLLDSEISFISLQRPDGTRGTIEIHGVEGAFFDVLGVRPIAGRFFDDDHPGDRVQAGKTALTSNTPVIISESAVREWGFSSPADAVGKAMTIGNSQQREIIGVAPDISIESVQHPGMSSAFVFGPGVTGSWSLLNVKLSGQQIPQTLREIDKLWNRLGDKPGPITRFFLDQYVEALYADVVRQSRMIAGFAAVTVLIAAFGLLGLASFVAQQRTKEIGIRKAMGATRADILRLLLWQFAKPVLWANVIAWPAAYFIMRRWLEGFAYHIDLQPWMFLAASALALAIALLTVISHALLVARAQPVTALRYE